MVGTAICPGPGSAAGAAIGFVVGLGVSILMTWGADKTYDRVVEEVYE